jgi:hypothetical protein
MSIRELFSESAYWDDDVRNWVYLIAVAILSFITFLYVLFS